ncbi:hypothetical protein RHMOL_Rhmol13G0308600 [Rhododendron molle]|uniref:Uncharacterized protein n=1 Tax=Rhododendron molle TaxID=49168 RepID=A0ACC0LE88_RHOML|nr:hypothetical protein RHMOL_Rhmol13G0308600 [Rhododendron molle]
MASEMCKRSKPLSQSLLRHRRVCTTKLRRRKSPQRLYNRHSGDLRAYDVPSVDSRCWWLTDGLDKGQLPDAMKHLSAASTYSNRNPVKFRIPTSDNLVPIRLDIEIDGQRFRDAFTWNPCDPDSEVVIFAKKTVKDLKLPPAFITQIAQSIQSQLTEFRSLEGQDMYTGEKIVTIKLDLRVNHTLIKDQFLWVSLLENEYQDLNNFESNPEEFARTFCADLGIEDPEVGIAIQSVASARETRINKKGRRGAEQFPASKAGGTALDLMKLFGYRSSVIRKRREWDVYEPIVDLLSNEEVEALEAREERSART